MRSPRGALPVRIYRPAAEAPIPFVVLLHGCGGLKYESMWSRWVEPWVDLLAAHGIGTAVVDSFGPRGVDQVCTGRPGVWAVRRADDAYSVRAWLAQQRDVDATHIAVMGMSNGGRPVLAALRTALAHPAPFAAVALTFALAVVCYRFLDALWSPVFPAAACVATWAVLGFLNRRWSNG